MRWNSAQDKVERRIGKLERTDKDEGGEQHYWLLNAKGLAAKLAGATGDELWKPGNYFVQTYPSDHCFPSPEELRKRRKEVLGDEVY